MSVLTASIISICGGLLVLFIRLFCFVDIKTVDKANLKRIQANSLVLIMLGILSLVEGIILLLIYRKDFVDPVETIINDFAKTKTFFSILVIFLGIVFLIYKEKIFEDWKKNGYKVPTDGLKYKTHIILLGILLLIVGGIILIL